MYSESDNHSYCHHEILLSAFPLALEWLDFDPEQPHKKGEYIVGCMYMQAWCLVGVVISLIWSIHGLGFGGFIRSTISAENSDGCVGKNATTFLEHNVKFNASSVCMCS